MLQSCATREYSIHFFSSWCLNIQLPRICVRRFAGKNLLLGRQCKYSQGGRARKLVAYLHHPLDDEYGAEIMVESPRQRATVQPQPALMHELCHGRQCCQCSMLYGVFPFLTQSRVNWAIRRQRPLKHTSCIARFLGVPNAAIKIMSAHECLQH